MNTDCVFCKIIAGALPCVKVYEDDDVLAFMDIGPVAKGHTLVVPKQHVDPITHTPPATLQKLIVVVQKIAQAQIKAFKADGINVAQANGRPAGQMVPHIHFHVIPRSTADEAHRNWTPVKYDSPEEMAAYGQKIAEALKQL
jgi:histidine triad (HIT) family protein